MAVVAGLAHHGDDLFHGRRVGGIEPPLVAGRTSGVVAGHGRGRATPTGGIEHCGRRSWDLLPIAQRTQSPLPYQRSRILASGITSEIALSLRHGDAEAGRSSTGRPALVLSGSGWRLRGDASSHGKAARMTPVLRAPSKCGGNCAYGRTAVDGRPLSPELS